LELADVIILLIEQGRQAAFSPLQFAMVVLDKPRTGWVVKSGFKALAADAMQSLTSGNTRHTILG
jgi:hypothetical protein